MENLNGLRVFVQVGEARSFTVAGRRLGLTSSGVSKAIAKLERSYGIRLLDRSTRSVALTAEGQEFFERCRHLLAELEEAETQLTQSMSAPRGRLRVHMPTAFGKRVVLPLLAQVLPRHPAVIVDVELGERGVDTLEEGFDAAIRFGDLPDSGLTARRLSEASFVVCASPEYLARHGEPRTPDDLDRHECLGYVTPWRDHYRDWQFAHHGRLFSRSVSGSLNVNNGEALLNAAIAGSGIAMIASFVAHDAVHAGQLRVLLRDYIAPAVPAFMLHLPGRQRSPRVRWLIEVLQGAISSPPPWESITERGGET